MHQGRNDRTPGLVHRHAQWPGGGDFDEDDIRVDGHA
jgi:hypothetical protein